MRTYSVSSDIKRAIFSKGFLFGTLGMVLMIAIASLDSIVSMVGSGQALPNGYHASLILKALSSQDVALVLPILCTFPFTAALVDDIKCGLIKPYLQRSGVKKYVRGKLIACGLSGGLVLFVGIVISYGLSALIFTPMEVALSHGQTAPPYFAQVLMIAAMQFLSGAFWSLVGCTLAALTMSRYMAYASPFIVYYVLIILHERYFGQLYVLYPKEWLFPSVSWVLGSFGVVLLLAELTAIVCLAFIITARRRLRNV